MGLHPLLGAASAAVRAPGAPPAGLSSSNPDVSAGSRSTSASSRSRAVVVPQSLATPRAVDRYCSQPAARNQRRTEVPVPVRRKGRLGGSPASLRQRGPTHGPLPARATSENGTSVKSKESVSEHAGLGTPTAGHGKAAPEGRGLPESSGHGGEEGSSGEREGKGEAEDSTGLAVGQGSAVLGFLLVTAIVGVGTLGVLYKDEINHAIDFFSTYIEEAGPLGYAAFLFGYAGLEVLAIPAIPLTMSAGLLFGPTIGTVLCSLSGTMAATAAFLIARYLARDRILGMVKGNKKFMAIDKAVGEDSFRVILLLRLSPLLPFSLGNYFYGITSLELGPYVLGSWLGMLPGTWAYVSAGAFGRTLLEADEGGVSLQDSSLWSLVAGLGVTVAAATYVTNLAKNAIKDID